MRGLRTVGFLLLSSLAIPSLGWAATNAPPAEAEPAPAPSKPPGGAVPAKAAGSSLPFRLGLLYAHAFGAKLPSPAVLGLDIGIGLGSHVRYHFAAGVEWEGQTGYAARGFRFDPITLGFPILIWENQDVAIHVEPLVHLVRGEILFQSQPANTSLFRIESGFAGAISLVGHHWFVAVEPISLDFRVFEANNQWVHTGFSQLWWFQITAGHEF
jgi:hypothetical protein